MRKILAALTIAVIVAIAPSAMAKGVKIPKSICISFDSAQQTHQLTFKATGTMQTADGKVKTYTVNGTDTIYPLTGSAYIVPGLTNFIAVYTTMKGQVFHGYNMYFDLIELTGEIQGRSIDNGTSIESFSDVTQFDCSSMQLFD